MSESWVTTAFRRLTEVTACPGCGHPLASTTCARCRIDLDDDRAVAVFDASTEAMAALRRREIVLDLLREEARSRAGAAAVPVVAPSPSRPAAPSVAPPLPAPVAPPTGARPAGPPPPRVVPPAPGTAPTVGLQQIIAPAGAGLLAAATVVFVFFTFAGAPGMRALVTGLVTLAVGALAPLLRRHELTATAESLAGLSVALLLADVELTLDAVALTDPSARLVRAGSYLVVCALLAILARRTRMRAWAIGAMLLVPVTTLMTGLVIHAFSSRDHVPVVLTLTLLLTALSTRFAATLGDRVIDEDVPFRRVKGLLTALRGIAFALALPWALISWDALVPHGGTATLLLATAAATAALLARQGARGWWFTTGAVAVAAGVPVALTIGPWGLATAPAGALAAWLLLLAVGRRLPPTDKAAALGGGTLLHGLVALPVLFAAIASTLGTLLRSPETTIDETSIQWASLPLGLTTFAIGSLIAARLRWTVPIPVWTTGPAPTPAPTAPLRITRPGPPAVVRIGRGTTPWLLALVLLVAACSPAYPPVPALVVPALLASGALLACRRPPRRTAAILRRLRLAAIGRVERRAWRHATLTAALLLTFVVADMAWGSRPTAIASGVVVPLLLLAVRRFLPAPVRPWLASLGYGYALVVLGTALRWTGLPGVEVLCAVAAVAALTATACTRIRRIDKATWWAILATTLVPFLLGVATLLVERTWWSAGAAAVMLGLEFVLISTDRDGAAPPLRALAALMALPTAAVVIVSAGSMSIVDGAASPIILPVLAVVTGATLLVAAPIADRVEARNPGNGPRVRAALELSVVVTAAVVVLLAATRPATGVDYVIAVLTSLAAAVSVLATRADRTPAWWVAAALWFAALWTVLGASDVSMPEAYTGPPALVAVVIGLLLSRRAPRWWPLARVGVALAVLPTLGALVVEPPETSGIRLAALTVGALVALGVAEVLRRREDPWTRSVAALAAVGAVAAGSAGLIEALWTASRGARSDTGLFWVALAWAGAGAVVAGLGGWQASRLVRPGGARHEAVSRWWGAPALVVLSVGTAFGMRHGLAAVAAMIALELALLALTVATVRRALRGVLDLPPTWFCWLAAMTVAIGGWSTRELRVEPFSVPLGLALILAGWWALRGSLGAEAPSGAVASPAPGVRAWPVGYAGSWRTVGAGLLALMGPSVIATNTDPATWRAVLVIAMALGAVVVGMQRNLAAPFVLGVIVLPVEVLVVFVSQLATKIDASSWVLTLVAAGGLLIVIAAYYERRIARHGGTSAYVRDLR